MSLSNGVLYSAPPPSPDYIPDFRRPYDGTALITCIGVFMGLALVATAIRIYTRARIVGAMALDDYLMIMAMVLSIILSGFVLNLFNFGLGKHLWDVPLAWLYPSFLFYNLLAAIFFCAATGFAKTSILLFYHRIFPSKIFHIVIWILVAFTAGYSAASVFVNIFSCNPIGKSWELKYAETGSCIDRPIFYFAQAGLGIFTDFATLIAPIAPMWKLQLPLRQKIGIAVILMTGGFVCIVSIIRLQSLNTLLKSPDLTDVTTPALMWCIIELNMSITGGCVPTFKPFFRKFFPSFLGSRSEQYEYGSHGASRNVRSHQLQSFDPKQGNGMKGFSKTTVTGVDQNSSKPSYGDNESEEYIIQPSGYTSDRERDRELAHSATNGPIKGYGVITRTVEFGYNENAHDKV